MGVEERSSAPTPRCVTESTITMILTRTASLSASAEELRRFSTPTLHRCVTVEERSSAPTPRCVTETTILGSQEPPKPKKLVKKVSKPKKLDKKSRQKSLYSEGNTRSSSKSPSS